MRIYVPYTRLRDETRDALEQHASGHEIRYVDVSGGDEAMWEMYAAAWAEGETFAVVEHDIMIHDRVLPAFEQCPSLWCSFAYPYAHLPAYCGTGCVRFRAELLAAYPELWEHVALCEAPPAHGFRHWCTLDGFSQTQLCQAGFLMCRHMDPVTHLDPSNSHGCL